MRETKYLNLPISKLLKNEGSEEWHEGVKAANNGLRITDSPYGSSTISGLAWMTGYNSIKGVKIA